MKLVLSAALATAAALVAAPACAAPAAPPPITSRFVHLNEQGTCREIDLGQEEVGDEVGKRCPGLGVHRLWIWYFDSVRLRVGFGRVGNLNGMFDAERNEAWPFEWRGRMVRGQFAPFAVIARLRQPGEDTASGDLVVFRLLDNGMSCIVATEGPGPDQNQRARAAADRILTGAAACEADPEPIAE